MSDTKDIGEILDSAQAPAPPEQPVEQQLRDDRGRYASPEPPPAAPQGAPQPEPAAPAAQSGPPPGYVPIGALTESRLMARQYAQRMAELEGQIADANKAKEPPPVDFFSDPDAAIKQRLDPMLAQMGQIQMQANFRASRAEAIASNGMEAVTEVEKAVGEAMERGDPSIAHLRNAMQSSHDPVGVALAWHRQRNLLEQTNGGDLAAFEQRIREKVMAEMQNGGLPPPQGVPPRNNGRPAAPPVMPSNLANARSLGARAAPTWGGPSPLQDIFDRGRRK